MNEVKINASPKIFNDAKYCGDGYANDWERSCCRFKVWDKRNSHAKCVLYDYLINYDNEKCTACKDELIKALNEEKEDGK